MMTAPKTITLQIDPFCNCEGCMGKVKKALGKLNDVKFLAMDPEIGKFTILTANHPETIKHAIKLAFPKKNITLLQELNDPYQLHVPNVDGIAKALVTMSQVEGLESVKYTQSNTFKLNFINGRNQVTISTIPPTLHNLGGSNVDHREDAPPLQPPTPPQTSIRPSAPPIPTTPDLVYGYPPEFYGYNKNHPPGCCTIL